MSSEKIRRIRTAVVARSPHERLVMRSAVCSMHIWAAEEPNEYARERLHAAAMALEFAFLEGKERTEEYDAVVNYRRNVG